MHKMLLKLLLTLTCLELLLLSRVTQSLILPKLNSSPPLPVILWHGMGDTCCLPQSMGRLQKLIEQTIPNIAVHSLMIGSNELEDEKNGFFMPVNQQIDLACQQILALPAVQAANFTFNAVGFSQGGQFLRAVQQRCSPQLNIQNLISIGGQQQGVYGFPNCPGREYFCNIVRKLLDLGAYTSFVQARLVQAQYWHDPMHEDQYEQKSLFLADINCVSQQTACNATYKENLMKIEKFVMVKFLDDHMVQPPESEWFGYYTPDQAVDIQSLNQTQLYTDDTLGLRKMDLAGKLTFLSLPGDHLQFTEEWFIDSIIKTYLA